MSDFKSSAAAVILAASFIVLPGAPSWADDPDAPPVPAECQPYVDDLQAKNAALIQAYSDLQATNDLYAATLRERAATIDRKDRRIRHLQAVIRRLRHKH